MCTLHTAHLDDLIVLVGALSACSCLFLPVCYLSLGFRPIYLCASRHRAPRNLGKQLTEFSEACQFLFSIFIVVAFFFSALTISEIFEDYIKDQKIKNVANKLLNIFAIIIPLITILGIFNLSI